MTRDELLDQLAQSALGELSPDEEKALRAYLATASEEEKRLAEEQAAVGAALGKTLPKAPRRVYDAIEREITADAAAAAPQRRSLGWTAAIAVAAVAGLLLYFINDSHQADVAAATQRVRKETQQQIETSNHQRELAESANQRCETDKLALERRMQIVRDVATLLENKGTRLVALAPPTPAPRDERATAIVSPDGKRALLFANHAAPPDGKTYQLWILRGKEAPIAAGFLQEAVDGTAYGEVDPAVLTAGLPDAFAISLEPKGGSAAPTEVVLVGKTKT